MSKGIFDDDEKVDKIVFRPLNNIDMAARVKKVSDPAPRPLPRPLDDDKRANEWIPGFKKSKKPKKESNVDYSGILNAIKWVFFGAFALGVMAGIAWTVLWVFEQYNI